MSQKIVIIGGGAAGMMAAVVAATKGAKVTIIEHQNQIGRKLKSTGNGRCNFTNLHQQPDCYRSTNEGFPFPIYERFPVHDTIAFFLQLGLFSKNRNGYMYPHSDQATAVIELFDMELKRLQVSIVTETKCTRVRPAETGFQIKTTKGDYFADKVILTTGSKAAPITGSDGSGYTIAKELGHTITPVLPALVQLRCQEPFYKKLAGLRIHGQVTLLIDGKTVATDTGEIQFTNYGISGIPVFQVSRYAAKGLDEKKEVCAFLDFMPQFSKEQLLAFLLNRRNARKEKTWGDFFVGVFPTKLAHVLLDLVGLSSSDKVGSGRVESDRVESDSAVTDGVESAGVGRAYEVGDDRVGNRIESERGGEDKLERLVTVIKSFPTTVSSTNSFEDAQTCVGGINTKEVNPDTLESLFVKGLYFAGEILDVDGICGGYNLQWAWSSGHLAGEEAAKCFESSK